MKLTGSEPLNSQADEGADTGKREQSGPAPSAGGPAPPPAAPPLYASSFRVALYAFALASLEWLFFVTKPSFLGSAPFLSRFATLWVTGVPFVAASLALHLVLVAIAWGLWKARLPAWVLRVGHALSPAALLTATSLLLIDNFVYTVFSRGLISIWGVFLVLPGAALLGLFLHFVRRSMQAPPRLSRRLAGGAFAGWIGCVALALGWLYAFEGGRVQSVDVGAEAVDRGKLPNILIIGADGVEAERLSAYGYRRKTTPNLDRYLDRAWVFENAFTNAGKTTGALTAMMTGRHPTATKVLYPPHTLRGTDAYLHLPRILRSLGYRGIQETVRYYADGEDLNWQQSFDEANDRPLSWSTPSAFATAVDHPTRLTREIRGRLGARMRHVLGIERMLNVYEGVTGEGTGAGADVRVSGFTDDRPRVDRLLRFIDESEGPWFAHIHLLEAHCCRFRPVQRVFSKEMMEDNRRNREDSYDDTILATDRSFGRMMDHLEAKGLLDNTIVVYMSDHTRRWGFKQRLPLIFFLPDGMRTGREAKPAQLIDIAPTLLQAMGLRIPAWMDGQSLFEELPQDRPIISSVDAKTERFQNKDGHRRVQLQDAGPPTYGLEELGLAHCQRWYIYNVEEGTIDSGEFRGYVSPCPKDRLLDDAEAVDLLTRHLREHGFSFAPRRASPLAER